MSDFHTLTIRDIETLLTSPGQWEKVDRITFITFKTLCDYLSVQSLKIEKLEKSLEYFSQISENNYQELNSALDVKVSFPELQQLLEKKVSKADLSYILANKPNLQDLKIIENKCAKLEDLEKVYEDLMKRWQDTLSKAELEEIYKLVETKASKIEVEEGLAGKANKQAVANALHKKIGKSEVENLISSKADLKDLSLLSTAIESKVEYSSFESHIKSVTSKLEEIDTLAINQKEFPLRSDLKKLEDELSLNQSNFFSEVEKLKLSLRNSIEKLKTSIESRQAELVSQTISENQEKISNESLSIKNIMKQKLDYLESEIAKLGKNFEKNLKMIEADFKVYRENNGAMQGNVKDLIRDQQKIVSANELIMGDLTRVQQDNKKLQKNIEELAKEMIRDHQNLASASNSLMTDIGKIQQDQQRLQKSLDEIGKEISKETQKTLAAQNALGSDIARTQQDLQKLEQTLDELASQDEVNRIRSLIEEFKVSLKKKFEGVHNEISAKVSNENFVEALNQKVNFEEINKSIEEMYLAIDKKLEISDFESQICGQNLINDALCAENRLARWIWKSGDLSSGHVVWDTQAVNTSEDIFVWEKGKFSIQVLQPGLYQLELGFFSKKKPTIGILVNGDTVIIGGNSTTVKPWGKSTSSGLTLIDYLVLPNRSRLSISYAGQPGEGFFGLKKL